MKRKEETDPYEAFDLWCKANGFADVIDCVPEDVNLQRLDEAIAAYGKDGER